MSFETWLAFVVASSVLLVVPGPTILTVISYSLAQGRGATPILVAGVALGDVTALALSLAGLGALLAASATLFAAVKIAGGLYLLWLGARLLRSGLSTIDFTAPAAPQSRVRMAANLWLITASNPKGIVFFVAFLPQFVRHDAPLAPQLWLLAATFVGLAIVNATLYAGFAATARRLLSSPRAQRRFHLTGGSLLCAAGVWALLARRPA